MGFLLGRSARIKVILRRGKKRNFKSQDGYRKLITVIETVSAGGLASSLTSMIIYEGETQYAGWHALVKESYETYFSRSHTGWTNCKIGLEYIKEVCNKHTVDRYFTPIRCDIWFYYLYLISI